MTRVEEIEAELAVLGEMRGKPAGTIRITATEHSMRTLIWPRLQPWLPLYADIKVEMSGDNRFTDIVAERFDVGVRLGGDVAKDMSAVRIAPDMRMLKELVRRIRLLRQEEAQRLAGDLPASIANWISRATMRSTRLRSLSVGAPCMN